jgi:hypothetical protein
MMTGPKSIELTGCSVCGAKKGEQCRRKNNPERHLHLSQTHVERMWKASAKKKRINN